MLSFQVEYDVGGNLAKIYSKFAEARGKGQAATDGGSGELVHEGLCRSLHHIQRRRINQLRPCRMRLVVFLDLQCISGLRETCIYKAVQSLQAFVSMLTHLHAEWVQEGRVVSKLKLGP